VESGDSYEIPLDGLAAGMVQEGEMNAIPVWYYFGFFAQRSAPRRGWPLP
jgi:hypothetical protein